MAGSSLIVVHENRPEIIGLVDFLENQEYDVTSVSNGAELNQKLKLRKPDLLMLPVEMSATNGIDLCQSIKSEKTTSEIFVILLSNRKEEFAQIAGLDSGADDFLFQPVQERVLLSRIKALLKRKRWGAFDWKDHPLIIDEERYLIIRQGVEYYLPKKEFEILSLLYSKPNKVFSREEIKNAIWENFEKVRGRTVDVHIRKIREKVGEDLITTIKGVGYRLDII
jgi:two-component system alkaline phosphatase synthesis response regulator PhoP